MTEEKKVFTGLINSFNASMMNLEERIKETEIYKTRFTVVDVETTGGKPPDHRITEIAAYKIEKFQIVDEFYSLVNPKRGIPSFIQKLTGITPDMVAEAPPARKVMPEFLEFVGDSIIVGHQVTFDLRFINAELVRAVGVPLTNRNLCTVRLSRILYADLPSRSLGEIARELNFDLDHHHRALDDSFATVQLLVHCLRLLVDKGLKTLDELIRFQYTGYQETKSKPSQAALQGKLVRLRPFNNDDLPNIYSWMNHPEVRNRIEPRATSGFSYARIKQRITDVQNDGRIFIIEKDGEPVGMVLFSKLVSKKPRSAEIQVINGDVSRWNKGYGTEATELAINYAFRFLHLKYLITRIYSDNEAGKNLAAKFGFVSAPEFAIPHRFREEAYVLKRAKPMPIKHKPKHQPPHLNEQPPKFMEASSDFYL